jgi:hypothetical protein
MGGAGCFQLVNNAKFSWVTHVLDIFHHYVLCWMHWKEVMSVPRRENRDQFHLMTESEAAYKNVLVYSKLKQWKVAKICIGLVSQTCRLTFTQRFQKFIHSLSLAMPSVVMWCLLWYGDTEVLASCVPEKQCEQMELSGLSHHARWASSMMHCIWMWSSVSECNVLQLSTFINHPTIDTVWSWYWQCC